MRIRRKEETRRRRREGGRERGIEGGKDSLERDTESAVLLPLNQQSKGRKQELNLDQHHHHHHHQQQQQQQQQ